MSERISVFDIFKIGVGPSSSHTMGPWRAAQQFITELIKCAPIENVALVNVFLYGSLAKTGKGHGTDVAVLLGLSGYDPETIAVESMNEIINGIIDKNELNLNGQHRIPFIMENQLHFLKRESLEQHANGMRFSVRWIDGTEQLHTYFSVGGGFIVKDSNGQKQDPVEHHFICPYPIDSAEDLRKWCEQLNLPISEIVMLNELHNRPQKEVEDKLMHLWNTMLACIYRGCHTDGKLPGGLNVERRAMQMSANLLKDRSYANMEEWVGEIRKTNPSFHNIMKWVSCFALAVNEENAAFGRVVTAPTNGAAGVIPAVLMYHLCFGEKSSKHDVLRFLLTASEIGSIFKKGATISAAMGGCQAEIGVSSAMAAGALTECLGGNYERVMMAAEIAMEHHLGMTCDPIGGLVQIPCIERNTMGAIKAIMAAQIALESNPKDAKVSLDEIVKTMQQTARDMNNKYKETAEGGLAVSVVVPEC